MNTGESGNVMSPHFDDMVIPFSKGELTRLAEERPARRVMVVPVGGTAQ
jgi:acyl-homoserine lactone acylase PvdQ